MTQIRPTLHCACGGKYLQEVFRYDARPEGETPFAFSGAYQRSYDNCSLCGHFFGRHAMDLAVLYTQDYVDATYGGPDGMRARFEKISSLPEQQSDNVLRVQRVNAFAKAHLASRARPWRVLDIGAGIGVFPAAMQAAGWKATGIEPDIRTVRHLREVAGIEARCGDIFALSVTDIGQFEAVTLNKVLEHVEDPVALLKRSASYVSDRGFLYIEVPDVVAAIEGADREEFFVEHHHIFSPESVAMMATRAGLELRLLERLREPSRKFTLAAFLVPR